MRHSLHWVMYLKTKHNNKNLHINLLMIASSLCVGAVNYLVNFKKFSEFSEVKLPSIVLPTWTIIVTLIGSYFLLGKAAALVCVSDSAEKSDALFIYVVQHAVCLLCGMFYFVFQEFFLALCWSAFLILLSVLMTTRFVRCSKNSRRFLYSYLFILLYAVIVVCSTWLQNK